MALTWLQFRTAVKAAMTDITASDDLFAAACAAYVKAKLVRDMDRDNILAKSYDNSYRELKRKLMGFQPTLSVGSTLDTEVKKLLCDVTANNDLFAAATAEYVKAMIAREVDHDPELFKSYYASYLDLKRRLLGFSTTLTVGGSLDVAVKLLLPVDKDREGVQAFITQQIKNGYQEIISLSVLIATLIKDAAQDIKTLSVLVDKLVREAAIDLQSYIDCYRCSQDTIYTDGAVTAIGNISRGALPEEGEILQAWFIQTLDELTDGDTYAPNDLLTSNGHTYRVVSGGTLSGIGSGLTSTDGTLEALGGLTFVFFFGEDKLRSPIVPEPWFNRYYWNYLRTNGCADRNIPAMLAIDPVARSFFVWPPLDDTHSLTISWYSANIDFDDGDVVPFTEGAQNAAREYALSKYYLTSEENLQLSRAHQAEYLSLRSRLYIDCQDRKRLRF